MQIIFFIGGLLILTGAAAPLFTGGTSLWQAVTFSLGVLMFGGVQIAMKYEGTDLVVRRLRRQQLIGVFFLVLTALLLFGSVFHIGPFKADEWLVTLAIATVFEAYTAFRLPSDYTQYK